MSFDASVSFEPLEPESEAHAESARVAAAATAKPLKRCFFIGVSFPPANEHAVVGDARGRARSPASRRDEGMVSSGGRRCGGLVGGGRVALPRRAVVGGLVVR